MDGGWLFLGLGALFFLVLVYIGVRARRWVHDSSDYILAGREVGTALNTFGVASIGFAGSSVALVPGMAVLYGFWPALVNQLTFSIAGLMAYGVFFAPAIRRCGAQTLPEWLELRFDARVRLVVTLGTIIGLTGIMANNVVSIAAVLTGFVEVNPTVAISIIFFVFITFSFIGGFWAITFTDFVQLLLGLVAVPIILVLLVTTFGTPAWVSSQWPEAWVRGSAGTLPIVSPRFPSILTSLVLFSSFLVWGNNYYWLRSASCRTERAARNSFVLAGAILAVCVYAPLLLIGTFTRAAFPELLGEADFFTATTVYGVFLRSIPPIFASLLLLVPLAAGVSTATTAHMGATAVVVRDIYQRRMRPTATSRELLPASKVILLLLGLLVWLLCFYPGGPLIIFAFATAWLGPPAILVLLGLTWPRFSTTAAFWSTVLGIGVMSVLTAFQLTGLFVVDVYLHVGMAGLLVSLSTAIVLTFLPGTAQEGHDGKPLTTGVASGVADTQPAAPLSKAAQVALPRIEAGYRTLAELTDLAGGDSADIHAVVKELEAAACIQRDAARGRGFYSFELTQAGTAAVLDDMLAEIEGEELLVLKAVASGELEQFLRSRILPSLRVATVVAKLVRDGYCHESGFWRRRLLVLPAGRARIDNSANALTSHSRE